MDEKKNNWFTDIAPPGKANFGDSAGYLDRLMGGGGIGQKSFLNVPAKKEYPPKNNHTKSQPIKQVAARPKNVAKLPGQDIDDANWIEERKRRFPKPGSGDPQPDINAVPSNVLGKSKIESSQLLDMKPDKQLASRKQELRPATRKKTLFEKLMDSDE